MTHINYHGAWRILLRNMVLETTAKNDYVLDFAHQEVLARLNEIFQEMKASFQSFNLQLQVDNDHYEINTNYNSVLTLSKLLRNLK